ncbi:hypothetical protein A2U01_0088361, partial [Trifolium medium]|nr:hypothetical protein [Trifolium medium]
SGSRYGKNFAKKGRKKGSNRWTNVLNNSFGLNGMRLWHRWRQRRRDIQGRDRRRDPKLHKVIPIKNIDRI